MTPNEFIDEARVPPRRRQGWGGGARKQFVWLSGDGDGATIIWANSGEEAYEIALESMMEWLETDRDDAAASMEYGGHQILEIMATMGEP